MTERWGRSSGSVGGLPPREDPAWATTDDESAEMGSRNRAPRRGPLSSMMRPPSGPAKRLFEMLLPLQPFTGFLSPITLRFQASPHPLANDRFLGVWREIWFGNSSPDRRDRAVLAAAAAAAAAAATQETTGAAQEPTPAPTRRLSFVGSLFASTSLYNPGQLYTILLQAMESHLGTALSSLIGRQYLRLALGTTAVVGGENREEAEEDEHKRALRDFEEGAVVQRRPLLYAGYLVVKCATMAAIYLVSHPLSIIRTVVVTRGDVPLPEEGFFANVLRYAGPGDALGLYRSSLAAHMVSGLAEVVVTDVGLRSLRWALTDYLKAHREASGVEQRRERRRQRRQGTTQRTPLPGTHLDRLRARLNIAAMVSAMQMGVSLGARALLFPLFTVRARLEGQGGNDVAPVATLHYAGMADCIRSILAEEGLMGFYRGFSSHLLAFLGNTLWIGIIYALSEAYIQLDVDEDEEED